MGLLRPCWDEDGGEDRGEDGDQDGNVRAQTLPHDAGDAGEVKEDGSGVKTKEKMKVEIPCTSRQAKKPRQS